MRSQVVVVVGRVVPDEQVLGQLAPAFDVRGERSVLLAVERLDVGTFDRAKTNQNVVTRLDRLGRLAGILVRQRFDQHVRELLLDRLGDLVEHHNERACVAFFRVVDRLALLAGTEPVPVVLRNVDHLGVGILPQRLQDVPDQLLGHFFVGQAKLRVFMLAFAVDFRVPVRMGGEILFRREILVERMDEIDDPHRAAVFRGQGPVALHAGGEDGRLGVSMVHFARDHLRRVGNVQVVRDDQRRLLRNERVFGRPPANADDVLQERIDRVQAASLLDVRRESGFRRPS